MNDIIKKYLKSITKVEYKNGKAIVYSNERKYIIIKRQIDKSNLYKYFDKIDYKNYKKPINDDLNDLYEIYLYDEKDLSLDAMINNLIDLEKKTIKVMEYDISKLIDEKILQIDEIYKYYLKMQDKIEEMNFPRPGEYLLINNISMIYKLLDFSKYIFSKVKKDTKFRNSILINKIDNNFVNYFIDYNYYSEDLFLYDIEKFYKLYYYKDIDDLIDKYLIELEVDDEYKKVFYGLLSIPWKVEFNDSNYTNSLKVRRLIDYTNKVLNYVSKQNKENQKTDESKLEEENKDI